MYRNVNEVIGEILKSRVELGRDRVRGYFKVAFESGVVTPPVGPEVEYILLVFSLELSIL